MVDSALRGGTVERQLITLKREDLGIIPRAPYLLIQPYKSHTAARKPNMKTTLIVITGVLVFAFALYFTTAFLGEGIPPWK